MPSPADGAAVSELARALLLQNGSPALEGWDGAQEEAVARLAQEVCLSSWGQSLPVCSVVGKCEIDNLIC